MTGVAAIHYQGRAWQVRATALFLLLLAGWLAAPVAQALGPAMAGDCDHCQVFPDLDPCQVGGQDGAPPPQALAPERVRAGAPVLPPAVPAAPPSAVLMIRPGADPPVLHRSRHLVLGRFLE